MVLREHGGAPYSFPLSCPHWLYHQNLLDMSTCHSSVLVRRLLRCKRLLVLQLLAIHRETLPPLPGLSLKVRVTSLNTKKSHLNKQTVCFTSMFFWSVFSLLLMKKDGRRQTTDMGEGGIQTCVLKVPPALHLWCSSTFLPTTVCSGSCSSSSRTSSNSHQGIWDWRSLIDQEIQG